MYEVGLKLAHGLGRVSANFLASKYFATEELFESKFIYSTDPPHMYTVVLITAPKKDAEKIARHLLERRVAACVNIADVKSLYWWEGKIEEDEEALLIVKTSTDKLNDLVKEVRAVHPYQVPEVIALPIVGGYKEYLSWVERETHA